MPAFDLELEDADPNSRLTGFITTVPTETAPQHAPRPSSLGSSLYSVKTAEPPHTGTSAFRSSPTAI